MYEYVKLLISIVYNNVLYFYMETFAYDGTYFFILYAHFLYTQPHEDLYFDCLI